ncbi:hypothetical protein ALC56_00227 [Trachymyrmex septentrionalis]|uniref:Complementary sex determination N-terminal domain-containing protein n=1 Tax=Trachymyrmex septentrionalis TaxID=34720 RepID=A0A195FXI5_9HYME|nr:hypothetical protein ALC56_00227 [Trachymyrmex septentrionalis]
MDSHKKWRFTAEELDRLRSKREKWHRDQERLIKYEKLRSRKINEYEERRKQAKLMKNSDKQEFLQHSKNNNPHRRKTSSPNYGQERKTSVIFNSPESIIDMKKLKVTIKADNLSTNYQTTSNNIECDSKHDIILPRRQDEGACPIFKHIEIKKSEEIRKITFSQDEQLESYACIADLNRSCSLTSERDRERESNIITEFPKKNYFDLPSDSSYINSYRLSRPMLMPMPRIPAPPMLMPVFPGPVLPMPFPPTNIYHQPYLNIKIIENFSKRELKWIEMN